MIRMTTAVLILLATLNTEAQIPKITGNEWTNPNIGSIGKSPVRTEFFSYDIREEAEKNIVEKNPYFFSLDLQPEANNNGIQQFNVNVDIPYMWLDRDLFLHVEGFPCFYLQVNGRNAGYGQDSRTPSEFNISSFVKDGSNRISILLPEGTETPHALETALTNRPRPAVFLYSQPKVRIEDYKVTAPLDSTKNHGILQLEIALSNSYNSPETITVGYDIYSPQGKLQYYDMREVKLAGQGRDTIRFAENIYGVPENLWSAEQPSLYRCMLTVRRGGRMVEYIPFVTGFGSTTCQEGVIYRNEKPIDIQAARYNAAPNAATTQTQLVELKKRGINTVWTDYPQPYWFYDLCDRTGMYVIDQANINSAHEPDNLEVGGTWSNNPAWLGSFLEREQSMYGRAKNHVCIIGWSLGGAVGNGYNMQKCYQWLKNVEKERAVLFNDAAGEWNSDLEPLPATDAELLLSQPAPRSKK